MVDLNLLTLTITLRTNGLKSILTKGKVSILNKNARPSFMHKTPTLTVKTGRIKGKDGKRYAMKH